MLQQAERTLIFGMSYKAIYESKFEKFVKKLKKKEPKLVEEIKQICQDILENPIKEGSLLTGNWTGFSSCHFHRSPEYRIIYKVYACSSTELDKDGKRETHICLLEEHTECGNPKECKGVVSFLFVNTREVFNRIYKLPKSEIKKYLYDL